MAGRLIWHPAQRSMTLSTSVYKCLVHIQRSQSIEFPRTKVCQERAARSISGTFKLILQLSYFVCFAKDTLDSPQLYNNGVHLQENAPFFRFEANSQVTHVKSDRCCPYNALSTSCTKIFARNRAKEYHDKCIIVQNISHSSVTCARYRSKFLHQNC